MPRLRFNDGVTVDTSGDLRPLHLRDGWYVVGRGMLMAVDGLEEALEWIDTHQSERGTNSHERR